MTLVDLSHLARPPADTSDATAWDEYRDIIEDGINSIPRNMQVRIGPSELGNPCDRCLIHKLAGTPESRLNAPWLPFIGTATHTGLEDLFHAANAKLPRVRFLIESTVSVGEVGGVDITGHADLFDLVRRRVADWKIVGKTTLDKVRRRGPSTTYRVQAHLYGRGFIRRGLPVDTVGIHFLPRNAPDLGHALVWEEPYDEQIALAALARANQFATFIAAVGPQAVLQAAPPHLGSEFSCGRYADGDQSPATADAFLGLG